ncbi:MAG: hypothetical protein A2015_12505 [Spirochaetes bacterium GWF1_31_7]|nr:MAG: hypothetical protein A2Y30_12505 [Spirochaetes bacterium GWE1_32_154]OHD44809.1 MAG: hypothetical protein A2Y29_03365 [Spirochaetes bacterium GWE2_31_10]OHD49601.1 MAG: hypothetical protein A2015_12505 [Spirochaetes bacterium GWF1_31_7]OHD72635.1 MAG: hypothetical protein A2355_11910 [Spirochaetes bacterium RIFOXYB1_FULL_32_8]HBD93760.1 hypothetical protein [Spirochaetia bacterium]
MKIHVCLFFVLSFFYVYPLTVKEIIDSSFHKSIYFKVGNEKIKQSHNQNVLSKFHPVFSSTFGCSSDINLQVNNSSNSEWYDSVGIGMSGDFSILQQFPTGGFIRSSITSQTGISQFSEDYAYNTNLNNIVRFEYGRKFLSGSLADYHRLKEYNAAIQSYGMENALFFKNSFTVLLMTLFLKHSSLSQKLALLENVVESKKFIIEDSLHNRNKYEQMIEKIEMIQSQKEIGIIYQQLNEINRQINSFITVPLPHPEEVKSAVLDAGNTISNEHTIQPVITIEKINYLNKLISEYNQVSLITPGFTGQFSITPVTPFSFKKNNFSESVSNLFGEKASFDLQLSITIEIPSFSFIDIVSKKRKLESEITGGKLEIKIFESERRNAAENIKNEISTIIKEINDTELKIEYSAEKYRSAEKNYAAEIISRFDLKIEETELLYYKSEKEENTLLLMNLINEYTKITGKDLNAFLFNE